MRSIRRLFLLCFCIGLCAFTAIAAKKKPPSQPINLNTASSSQLQQVPGIGPVTADKILQMRKSYGTFKSVDDLTAIRGIGPKKMDKMRKYLTVTRPQPASATHAKNCTSCGPAQKPRSPAKPTTSTTAKSTPPPTAPTKKTPAPAPTQQDAEAEEQ
jgi:competence ComEA-like helix-hairpin-helix protein